MSTYPCILTAWHAHEKELRGYLIHRLGDPYGADDLLQDVFLKSLRQGADFCRLDNPRAWLFQVARHAVIDQCRLAKPQSVMTDDLAAPPAGERDPVEQLDDCLMRNLAALSIEDHNIISQCDLHGMKHQVFADNHGLSLSAVKSRLMRARQRLHAALLLHCQVRFDEDGKVCCHKPRGPLS
ncbi:sigma-70 family RNA polymerase sigma factor [Acerihabitans sp. TG2]|uniref:RNA polymerase sigma factor n=1 Tax=Acerihabitans sp. TG2 TaxID=3096008 RepID=UPI002B229DCB|nr:sigma-70 family RNA polymerase sigma factor [Acerihabitans sp. TG2]MEA9389740.1 sigma-70 family RNA polymerase sigma factor [Acerihabitans sp. TG2]